MEDRISTERKAADKRRQLMYIQYAVKNYAYQFAKENRLYDKRPKMYVSFHLCEI